MYNLQLLVIIVLAANCAAKSFEKYEGYKALIVKGDAKELSKLPEFFSNYKEIVYVNHRQNEISYLVDRKYVSFFENTILGRQLKYDVVFDNFSKVIEEEKRNSWRSDFSWDAYHDVDMIYDYLRTMSESYPQTDLIIGGKSYEGRPIFGLRIMNEDEKPAIVIESGIHAREWITPAAVTYFINELLTNEDSNITYLRENFDWHIFPTVNPDGYHYSYNVDRMWRKTRSMSQDTPCIGVDANRNWDHNWNVHGTSSDPCHYQVYAGNNAFSEIETLSLSKYISNVRGLAAYVALHADAQMLLVPYSDSTEHISNYDDLIRIGKVSLEYGERVNGAKYNGPATAAEILYKASGGSMDWVREALNTPLVYTYELRGKFFHWPPHRIPEQGDELTQMLLGLMLEADKLGYFK